jgi:omega-6 fatty acid desaturase (delta-12 desaturase)
VVGASAQQATRAGVTRPSISLRFASTPSLVHSPRKNVSAAAAVTAAPPLESTSGPTGLNAEQRAELAEQLGYRQIGEDLPDDITLKQVIGTLPRDVFQINPVRAWAAVITTLVSMAASLWLIANSPWYLLPFAWALAGTAFTGFFVVGHDAGHRSFSKNKLVEDIVGTLMFAPLIYPFEPWRIKHNHHHAHTNKLVEDTAWHPVMADEVTEWGDSTRGRIFKFFLGTPLKLWASVGHWALWHFDISKFTERQRPRVYVSWAACAAFALGVLPALTVATGWAGLVKFWLMPWLGYHFWMSTFTVIHHTAPHIPFKPAESWNAAQAQLAGTVHCDFPKWVEFLTHDISVHVPHHVNSKIPWYNLRAANDSLRANWGKYMTEASFNWRMIKNICAECHVFDPETNYRAFDTVPGAPKWKLFEWQRRFLPNTYTAGM